MNKKFLFIGIIAVILIIAVVFFVTHKAPLPTSQPSAPLPTNVLPNAPQPPYSSLPLAQNTNQATAYAIQNSLKDAAGNPIIADKNNTQTYVLAQETDYSILFFGIYDSFLIDILKTPFDEKRKEAELRFLQIINAPPTIACQLNVRIATPAYANPNFAGQTFRLSFCK